MSGAEERKAQEMMAAMEGSGSVMRKGSIVSAGTRAGRWRGALAVAAALVLVALLGASASAEAAPTVLRPHLAHAPANLPPGGTGLYELRVANIGDAPSSGEVSATLSLPAGVRAVGFTDPLSGGSHGAAWDCEISADGRTLDCALQNNPIPPGLEACNQLGRECQLLVTVEVDSDAAGSGEASVEVSDGGVPPATGSFTDTTQISSTPAGFGIYRLSGELLGSDLTPASQAGSHPRVHRTKLEFNSIPDSIGDLPLRENLGDLKTVRVDMPPGLIVDPGATPMRCSREEFKRPGRGAALDCPELSQVGAITVQTDSAGAFTRPLFNLEPPPGLPAQFGSDIKGVSVFVNGGVDSGGDYSLTAEVRNAAQFLGVVSSEVTLWGFPTDSVHDHQRGPCGTSIGLGVTCPVPDSVPRQPLLTLPTSCSADPLRTTAEVAWWQDPGTFDAASFDRHHDGTPIQIEGCERVPFDPEISIRPTTTAANSPTGLEVELSIPQNRNPDGLAQAHLKTAEVTLPEGMAVNPAAVDGLAACTSDEIALDSAEPPSCPDASKLGTVQVDTPLLEDPLRGHIYQAAQSDNPFDSLLAIYIVVEGPGVVVKLPGEVSPDPETGQLKTTFEDNPQLPFSKFTLRFKGGPRAPLVNPSDCGTHAATWELSPWSGTAPVSGKSTFELDRGCGEGGFEPSFAAGTASPIAGANAPFLMRLGRKASEPEVRSVSLDLPEGLSAKLAGIPYCSEDALSAFGSDGITEPGTAASEIEGPACPAESLIGEVTVGAGAGPTPFYLDTARAYLAGPYRGAPLSVAIVTAAKAGPFDLGNVLVRSALYVNERTAEITVRSDEIPAILEGIPLNVRDIRVGIDREGFSLNPTSCKAKEIGALVKSHSGPAASLTHPFQVTNCAALGFEPRFGMQILNPGRRSTLRSFNPAMRFSVVPRPGDANIDAAQVVLPSSVILDQSNIRTVCTRDQFAEGKCPEASVYGFARAWSPLLDEPLTGPVFLGSSPNPLPDIIADLGGQVDVVVQGQIDSVRPARRGRDEFRGARMRNTFRVVPDVPVSRFSLTMFGGRNRGVLVNSRDLCTSSERGVSIFRGQNGRLSVKRPAIGLSFRGCRKVRRMELRRSLRRKAVIRKALSSGSLTPSQARRQIRS